MDLGLKGKSALVAGGSQGIGRAVAEALAREGANVGLTARGDEALNRAAREICERHGVGAMAVPSDLSRREGVSAVVAGVRKAFGGIDILITNAGGPPSGPFEGTDEESWFHTFDLTLMSVVRLCREVLPGMKERGWGRIVHLTSVSVKQPIPHLVLSNTLRAGVAGLSKTLSEEYGRFGITVNCVAPGYTATSRLGELAAATSKTRGVTESEVRAGWIASTPAGRLGEPAEVADLVAFLCSTRAGYVNGTVIAIDGGQTRGLL